MGSAKVLRVAEMRFLVRVGLLVYFLLLVGCACYPMPLVTHGETWRDAELDGVAFSCSFKF